MLLNPIPEEGLGRQPNEHDQPDLDLLISLSAVHYVFGRFEACQKLVAFALWIDPHNLKALEMGAVIASRLSYRLEAVSYLNRIEDLAGPLAPRLDQLRTRCQRLLATEARSE